jgi:excisionase family DNA binding protein
MNYFTVEELLTATGLSQDTFYRWIKRGYLPFLEIFKNGKRFKVYQSLLTLPQMIEIFDSIKKINNYKRGVRNNK